jgi:hypothetical protein
VKKSAAGLRHLKKADRLPALCSFQEAHCRVIVDLTELKSAYLSIFYYILIIAWILEFFREIDQIIQI